MSNNNQIDFDNNGNREDINLKRLFSRFKRNIKFIFKVTLSSIAFGSLYLVFEKPTWEGQFQIVLRDDNTSGGLVSSLMSSNPLLGQLIGVSGGESDLKTEVEILQSPSILLPVFEFLKNEKEEKGYETKNWNYKTWQKKHLLVNLEPSTSVLNIKFQDKDKDLIVPILSKISNEYQYYSGRDKAKSIEQTLLYLKDQISIYKQKSKESSRKAYKFALDNDLSFVENLTFNNIDNSREGNFKSNTNFSSPPSQTTRVNEIRILEENIKQLKLIKENPEKIIHFASSFSGFKEGSGGIALFIDEIVNYEKEIKDKSIYLTDNDPILQKLIIKKNNSLALLASKLEDYLETQQALLQSENVALERPQKVLIKYRELYAASIADIATLTELEAQERIVTLESQKALNPWQLITNPTLFDQKIKPRKSRVLGLSLILGLFLGFALSSFKEIFSGYVYDEDMLKDYLDDPLLETFNTLTKGEWIISLKLILNKSLNIKKGESITFIKLGNVKKELLEIFIKEFKNIISDLDIFVTDDLLEAEKSQKQIIITSLGSVKINDLIKFRKRLIMRGENTDGIILIQEGKL